MFFFLNIIEVAHIVKRGYERTRCDQNRVTKFSNYRGTKHNYKDKSSQLYSERIKRRHMQYTTASAKSTV